MSDDTKCLNNIVSIYNKEWIGHTYANIRYHGLNEQTSLCHKYVQLKNNGKNLVYSVMHDNN